MTDTGATGATGGATNDDILEMILEPRTTDTGAMNDRMTTDTEATSNRYWILLQYLQSPVSPVVHGSSICCLFVALHYLYLLSFMAPVAPVSVVHGSGICCRL